MQQIDLTKVALAQAELWKEAGKRHAPGTLVLDAALTVAGIGLAVGLHGLTIGLSLAQSLQGISTALGRIGGSAFWDYESPNIQDWGPPQEPPIWARRASEDGAPF